MLCSGSSGGGGGGGGGGMTIGLEGGGACGGAGDGGGGMAGRVAGVDEAWVVAGICIHNNIGMCVGNGKRIQHG